MAGTSTSLAVPASKSPALTDRRIRLRSDRGILHLRISALPQQSRLSVGRWSDVRGGSASRWSASRRKGPRIRPTAPVGPLLENFAIGEVARQLTWAEEPVQLFHYLPRTYRDRDQVEVDMVLEHADGTVIGIEVKAAETVRGEDFRSLRHLANRLGDRFRTGIVLYAGEQQLSFGDRLIALPMAALWALDGSDS